MTDMTPSQQRQRQQQQQQQRQQPLSLSLSSFSFFERINDVDTLSPDDFLDRFEKYGFFWFKGTSSSSSTKGETILNFIKEHAVACEKSWTVENHGNGSSSSSSSRGRDSSGNSSSSNGNKKKMKQITTLSSPPPRIVTPQTLCNFTGTNESFYVSTIVHRKPQQQQQQQQQQHQHENDGDDGSDDKIDDNNDTSLSNVSSSTTAYRCLIDMLPKFDNVFEDIYETGDPSGLWMFIGHHGVSSRNNNNSKTKKKSNGDDDDDDDDDDKKRKRKRSDNANNANDSNDNNDSIPITSKMIGRAEHVDEVTHSGTYHIQIAGTKTWWIRPHPDCSFLNEELSSLVSSSSSSSLDNTNHNNNSNCFSRMKINVEEGDVFVLNTKIWYHNTELEYTPTKLSPSNNNNNNNESNSNSSSGGEWSISIAQDFYLPVPCPKDVSKGDVVYGFVDNDDDDDDDDENNIDDGDNDEIPDEIPRSDSPNCVLVEIEMGECNNDDDNDSDNDGEKIALIALRNIIEGESLSIAFDDQDGGDDQLGNANEQIDPRIISEQYWTTNQIVLRGENRIPNDIPRSYEPNCQLIEIDDTDGGGGNVCLALRALMDIPIGGVFCISPDDDEEYEEVEVDLGTGELVT